MEDSSSFFRYEHIIFRVEVVELEEIKQMMEPECEVETEAGVSLEMETGAGVSLETGDEVTLTPGSVPVPTFDDILSLVEEEESRMRQDLSLNEGLVPKEKKRGVSSIAEDKDFLKFLKNRNRTGDGGTFLDFIKERRNQSCWDSILNHCAQFVTYVKVKGVTSNGYQTMDSEQLIETVIVRQPALFHEYLNNLLREGALKPGTIQNRIDSLQYLMEWFRCNSSNEIYYKFSNIIERLKEERNRFQSINRKKSRENSIENMLKKRQWIEDGVEGLQRMMLDSWTYFDALISFSCFMPLNRQRYSWILCYALASMWCLAVNARVKSIEKLTMKGFQELQQKKFHLSTSFKTCTIYHYQVIQFITIV